MAHHKLLLLIAIVTIFSLIACASDSNETNPHFGAKPVETAITESQESAQARVIVTKDFGQLTLLDETIELTSSLSALEALQEIAIVETKYGGGFIHDINDTRANDSGGDKDWFVYLNGIQSNTGAGDYSLNPGDIEHWDFHDWGFRQFTPAIIGNFPEPFVHGYSGDVWPTVIVYNDIFEPEANELIRMMRELEIDRISAKSIDELPKDEKKSSNLILLCNHENELVSELNDVWDRMGFFAHFEDGMLMVTDTDGDLSNEYGPGTGLIQATQNPWNSKGTGTCENVVWMITGTDKSGVRHALNAFIHNYEEFTYAFAVMVDESGIFKIPESN